MAKFVDTEADEMDKKHDELYDDVETAEDRAFIAAEDEDLGGLSPYESYLRMRNIQIEEDEEEIKEPPRNAALCPPRAVGGEVANRLSLATSPPAELGYLRACAASGPRTERYGEWWMQQWEQRVASWKRPVSGPREGKVKLYAMVLWTDEDVDNKHLGPSKELQKHLDIFLNRECTKFCYQEEESEDSTIHYQIFLGLKKEWRLRALALHLLEAYGIWSFSLKKLDAKQYGGYQGYWRYCQKKKGRLNGPWMMGGPSGKQGQRTDLIKFRNDIKAGKTDEELIEDDDNFANMLKYHKMVPVVREAFKAKPKGDPYPIVLPDGQVLHNPDPRPHGVDFPAKFRHPLIVGPTNARKTGWLNEQFSGKRVFYVKNCKYPFEGYDNEQVCIWDMWFPTWSVLEFMCDYKDHRCNAPGDQRYQATVMEPFVARTCIILCNPPGPNYEGRMEPFNQRFITIEVQKIKVKERTFMPTELIRNTNQLLLKRSMSSPAEGEPGPKRLKPYQPQAYDSSNLV